MLNAGVLVVFHARRWRRVSLRRLHTSLSLGPLREITKSIADNMADLIVCIVIFATLTALYGHRKIRSGLWNRGGFFEAFQEWQQGKVPSTTRQNPPQKTRSENTYANILPPSRQFALPDHIKWLSLHESGASILKNQVDMDMHHASCKSTQYTPTGISLGQIEQLGHFADYASLSGVPLPSPCPEFDIDRALPRPYRPFRWNYHQTMCM